MSSEIRETSQNITFKGFVQDNASNMFGLDRRLWKTLKLLLFSPGKLTQEYLEGDTSQYTAPTTLYFSINFLFFFFQPLINSGKTQLLNFRYAGFTIGDGFHKRWIDSDLAKSGLSEAIYQVKFDSFITYNQPALIFMMVPLLALFIALVELKSGRKFIDHMVHAFHYMTFFLILFMLVAGTSNFISWALSQQFPEMNPWLFPIALFSLLVLLILYWFISFRRLGTEHWAISLLKSLVMTIGFFGTFLVYINILLLWTIFNVG